MLRELRLSKNKLQDVPTEFHKLESATIYLSDNPIDAMSDDVFNHMHRLRAHLTQKHQDIEGLLRSSDIFSWKLWNNDISESG